jgi:transcriptional accessory protein Tex/SPT6
MTDPERKKESAEWKEKMKRCVEKALHFIRKNYLEVPFLRAHRKDHFDGYLSQQDLWTVFDMDLKYQDFNAKRKSARTLLSELRKLSETAATDSYPDVILQKANDVDAVADVLAYLQLHFHSDLQKVEDNRRLGGVKRSIRRSAFEDAKKEGIDEFVKVKL